MSQCKPPTKAELAWCKRLGKVLDYCWHKDIADLATEILKKQKETIDRIIK
jgi:hypothetical protein